MTNNNVAYQLKPKRKHSCNYAKKAIQNWKDSFLLGMTSTHPDFPLSQWCKLVEQGKITLNLLRPSRLNPKLPAYDQVLGAFNYQKNSFPPPSIKVPAHVLSINHR